GSPLTAVSWTSARAPILARTIGVGTGKRPPACWTKPGSRGQVRRRGKTQAPARGGRLRGQAPGSNALCYYQDASGAVLGSARKNIPSDNHSPERGPTWESIFASGRCPRVN